MEALQIRWLSAYTGVKLPVPQSKGGDKKGGDEKQEDGSDLATLKLEFEMIQSREQLDEAGRKSRLIAQGLKNVFAYKDVLEAAFSYQAGSKGDMQKAVDYEHGNQEDEVDTDDLAMRRNKGEKIKIFDKDGKENAKAAEDAPKAMAVVFREANVLTGSKTTRTTFDSKTGIKGQTVDPLFLEVEITNDFYGALKRARLISDSQLANKSSATQKMLDDVGDLYVQGELVGAKDPSGNVKDITSGIANLGAGVANLVTSQLGVDTTMVKDLISAGTTLATLGMDAGSMALGLEEKDFKGLAAQVPALLGNIVSSVTGNKEIGGLITGAGGAAIQTADAAITKLKGKKVTPADVGAIFNNLLANVLTGALSTAGQTEAANVVKLISDAAASIDFTKAAGIAEGIKKGDFKVIMSGVLSMLSDVAKVAGTLAADGAKAANQTLDKAMGDDSKAFGGIASGVLALASSAMLAKDGADLAAKLEAGVPDVLGKITDAVVGQTTDLKNIGTAVTAAASAAVGIGELIRAKAKGDDITPAMIGTALGNCIDVAMKAADADLSNSKASNAADVQKALDAVAKQLKAAADGFGKSPEAAKLLAGDKKAAGKLLLMLLINAPAAASSSAKGFEGDSAKAASDALDKADAVLKEIDKAGEQASGKMKEADEQIKALEKAIEEKRQAEIVDKANDLVDELQQQNEEWAKTVKAALQPGGDQKAIMQAIAEMKKNEAILKSAIAVGSGGFAVASLFFAPMAAAGQLLQMTAHMTAAVQRAIDLKKMLDAQKWAESGASMYRSAIDNFVKNQGDQLTEHSIKAAMCAIRAASEIAASAYPMAKAGAAGVALAQQAVDVGFMIYKEAQLRAAWKTTKDWLGNRNNRRLGLKAQRLNSTLAKYAIAYGADNGDPVATKTLNEIGLTNQMLQSEEAGVSIVKAWLEARFSEDQKIAFQWETTQEWQKQLPEPALSQQNVFGAFAAIALAADPFMAKVPALIAAPPNAMVGSLNKYLAAAKLQETAKKKTDSVRGAGKAEDAKVAALEAFRDALTTESDAAKEALRLAGIFRAETTKVVGAVHSLSPDKPGAPKDNFKGVRSGMADVVSAYGELMSDEIDALEADLITPLIELTKVQAQLKVISDKKQPASVN